ncbi:MAG TPA: VCBS repeat-containing protein [Terriglobales bacterium]|nr:VCBS repeat-containing protein [Terriglobales bacterium]
MKIRWVFIAFLLTGVQLLGSDNKFLFPRRYITGVTYPFVLADFDGDGKADLVTARGNFIVFYHNPGDGNFGERISSPAPSTPYAIFSRDLNADGKRDLVWISDTLNFMLGNGDGTFAPATTTSEQAAFAAIADVNGDQKPDVVTVQIFTDGGEVFLGRGDGTFDLPLHYMSTSNSLPWQVTAGDFNLDGKVDLAVCDTYGLAVVLGNGDGTFQAPTRYLAGFGPSLSIISDDLNHDGILDLVTADFTGSEVSVLLGNGDGTFQASSQYALRDWTWWTATGDFNGDHKRDVVIACSDNAVYRAAVQVLAGKGDGTFLLPAKSLPLPRKGTAQPTVVVTADLNGDGISDIAVGDTTFVTGILVYLSNPGASATE